MKFILTNIKDFKKRLDITVPAEQILKTKKQEIINIRKKTMINGFRKNKIPIEIIEQRYKKEIENNTIQKTIYNNFKKIVELEKLHIIDEPEVIIHKYKKHADFTYSINFQSLPKIDFSKLKKKNIKKTTIIIDKKDIKHHIDNMRKKQISWKNNNTQVKKNDQVTIDYCIKEKNKFEINKIKTLTFIINKKEMLPQIEKQLLKKKLKDIILVTIHVPKTHPDPNYKNKILTIKIKIQKILEPKEEFSHDQFIKLLIHTLHVQNEIDVNNIINNKLKKDVIDIEYQYLKQQIMDHLKNSNIIKIPKILLKEKKNIIKKQLNKKYLLEGNIIENKYYRNLKKNILNKTKINLIIKSIIYHNNIQVTKQEIQKYLQYEKKNNHEFIKIIQMEKNKNKIQNYIHNTILEQKVINHLLNYFSITHETINLRNITKNMQVYY